MLRKKSALRPAKWWNLEAKGALARECVSLAPFSADMRMCSDGFMIGTEGRVVYAPEEDRESHIVLLWENPFVGRPRFEPRLASADIVALQYVNSGNASEVVFDLQESDGEGKAVRSALLLGFMVAYVVLNGIAGIWRHVF